MVVDKENYKNSNRNSAKISEEYSVGGGVGFMRKTKNILCFVLCMGLIMVGGEPINTLQASDNITEEVVFEYPITPEDAEWHEIESVEEKIEVCRIPADILCKMTNEQLYEAIMDFPFLVDVFIAPSIEAGIESLERTCDAYCELLRRDDVQEFLMEKVAEQNKKRSVELSVKEEFENNVLASLVLFQEDFYGTMSITEIRELTDITTTYETSDTSTVNLPVIYTPNGTPVEYIKVECDHSQSYHETVAKQVADVYDVVLVEVGNCKYNCHSFAWYNTLASNEKWINDPAPYMIDGSYTRVMSGGIGISCVGVQKGDVIFYGNLSDLDSAHSAKMVNNGTGAPIATAYVYSKWGSYGVYKHTVTSVPEDYDTTTVSVWHIAIEEEEE